MRRYTMTIDGTEHVVDVEEISSDTFDVVVAGHRVEVRLDRHDELGRAAISPIVTGSRPANRPSSHQVTATQITEITRSIPTADRPRASAATTAIAAAAVTSVTAANASATPVVSESAGAAHSMTSPMPGSIHSIDVSVGGRVAKGDPVMVLEAMKMNNVLRAPVTGTVVEILVAAGTQVKYGDVLARIAADEP